MKAFKILTVYILSLFLTGTAFSATSTSIEIKEGAEELKNTLEAMPYAKTGKGTPLYIFQFPDCPYSQAFYKDYQGNVSGIQMRHFFYAVSQKSANETAGLARNPRGNVYHMLMRQSTTAQAYDKNKKRLNAYNRVMEPLNDIIIPTLKKNGWPKDNLVSPTFIWEENGKWLADGGYKRDHFETLLASLRKADPTGSSQQVVDNVGSKYRHQGAPLKTTEVQGIKLGMTMEVAQEILKQKGYTGDHGSFKKQDEQSVYKSVGFTLGQYTKEGKSDQPFIKSIVYEQRYKPEIKFPTEALKEAVLEKYGQPLNEVKQGNWGNYSFSYQPPQLDRRIVEQNCTNEMNIKGIEPYKEGYTVLHPMLFKVWQERGFREVEARCPDQLEDFKKVLDFQLGVWSSISIDPRTKIFKITIEDHGPEQYKWRWLKEEKLLKQDSGPVGTVDL